MSLCDPATLATALVARKAGSYRSATVLVARKAGSYRSATALVARKAGSYRLASASERGIRPGRAGTVKRERLSWVHRYSPGERSPGNLASLPC